MRSSKWRQSLFPRTLGESNLRDPDQTPNRRRFQLIEVIKA